MTAVAEPTTDTARVLAWDEALDPDAKAAIPHPIDDFGAGWDGEPEPYKLGPDLVRVAVALIQQQPNRLGHIRQFSLAYLWTDTLGKSGGAERWWKVIKPTKELRWALRKNEYEELAAADALVEFSASAARAGDLSWWELQALVNACLRTIDVNDEGEVRIVPFTDQLQAEIAARYGTWSPSLKRLADALVNGADYQQRLDLELEERQRKAVEDAEEKGKQAGKAEAKAELREVLNGALG